MVYNDNNIIQEVKAGSEEAFDYIFNRYYAQLCYYAFGFNKDPEESKNIVHDTFVTFWSLRQNFESLRSIRAFLYISIRNASITYLRKKNIQPRIIEFDTLKIEPLSDDQNWEEIKIKTEVIKTLYNEIDNLPSQCKKIIRLRLFENLTIAQIAHELNLSNQTVKNQLSRAKQLLRLRVMEKQLLSFLFLLIFLR